MNKSFRLCILLFLSLFLLFGCSLKNKENIEFLKNDYRRFTFNRNEYVITNNEVNSKELRKNMGRFYKLFIVNPKTQEILKSSTTDSVTLAYNNLYECQDKSLCIGVNDKYFKVMKKDEEKNPEIFDAKQFNKGNNTKNDLDSFSIDNNDSRKITYSNHSYIISDQDVPQENLDQLQSVLAEVRVFDPNTGQSIPRSEWSKFDKDSKSRVEWDYGPIYSIKGTSLEQSFAIEINNTYKLAIREDE